MNDTPTTEAKPATERRMLNEAVARYHKLLRNIRITNWRASASAKRTTIWDGLCGRPRTVRPRAGAQAGLDGRAILLGRCELALGARDRARAAFERALELAIVQHHEGPQAELKELLQII